MARKWLFRVGRQGSSISGSLTSRPSNSLASLSWGSCPKRVFVPTSLNQPLTHSFFVLLCLLLPRLSLSSSVLFLPFKFQRQLPALIRRLRVQSFHLFVSRFSSLSKSNLRILVDRPISSASTFSPSLQVDPAVTSRLCRISRINCTNIKGPRFFQH